MTIDKGLSIDWLLKLTLTAMYTAGQCFHLDLEVIVVRGSVHSKQ